MLRRDQGERGLTCDSWNYHFQNREVAALAAAAPGTTMVLNHLGTPLRVRAWHGQLDEIYPVWKDDIAAIAKNENVVAKIGGLAMPTTAMDGTLGHSSQQ